MSNIAFLPVLALFIILNSRFDILAVECPATDYDCQISQIQKEIDALTPAHEQNKKELSSLKVQLDSLDKRIKGISAQLVGVAEDIAAREEDLAYAQRIVEEKAQTHYRFIRLYDPVTPFLSAGDATVAFREINFRQRAIDADRETMIAYGQDLVDLKNDKESLEKNRASLSVLEAQVDERASFLQGEVAKVESYLATLSARQQQFIALKLGSLNLPTSLGGGPLYCTDDRKLDPGFSPAFAFFTFGIPHRVGMNQYGALGRANAGQNHEDILRAYFNDFNFETRGNINITVEGYGAMPLETYLLGIYEMPESWPLEAQKAQAIAARSYALAYTAEGAKSICTSQKCQVFKNPPKSGNWKTAVEATSGKVMSSGGSVITAWYASTAGGYTYTSADVGWRDTSWTKRMQDTSVGIGGFGELMASAYDRESPCFYAAQGWRGEYSKSAWIKGEELADIVNVIMLARYSDVDKAHLYQVDKPNPEGVDTWDEAKVRQELQARDGSPLSGVVGVNITGSDWSVGRTTQVTVEGRSFDGTEFKNFFNLRAPANIQIVGPLYNVESRI